MAIFEFCLCLAFFMEFILCAVSQLYFILQKRAKNYVFFLEFVNEKYTFFINYKKINYNSYFYNYNNLLHLQPLKCIIIFLIQEKFELSVAAAAITLSAIFIKGFVLWCFNTGIAFTLFCVQYCQFDV